MNDIFLYNDNHNLIDECSDTHQVLHSSVSKSLWNLHAMQVGKCAICNSRHMKELKTSLHLNCCPRCARDRLINQFYVSEAIHLWPSSRSKLMKIPQPRYTGYMPLERQTYTYKTIWKNQDALVPKAWTFCFVFDEELKAIREAKQMVIEEEYVREHEREQRYLRLREERNERIRLRLLRDSRTLEERKRSRTKRMNNLINVFFIDDHLTKKAFLHFINNVVLPDPLVGSQRLRKYLGLYSKRPKGIMNDEEAYSELMSLFYSNLTFLGM